MAQLLPLTLLGDNLGQRHRYLNSRVNQAAADLVSFEHIQDLTEQAPIDRIFKIDLANKIKNVDFILKNIKDDDMLYVSRALKCKWLLEHRDIINPNYLEDVLYPEMVLPAISKMKHWLYINLRDPIICQEFYQYYKETAFEYAVKFLNQCNDDYLLDEFPKILIKITPHYLKVLGEKYPKLVQIYYDALATNNDLINRYLTNEQEFYNNIKCLLKLDPDMFLDITEKYHSLTSYNSLSPSATKYILRFHKSRFIAKPELYVIHLLHMRTVAKCLSAEECQDLVIKLARADYLNWLFSFRNVEPLVKRVSPDKRAAFKKRMFVHKDIGDLVAKWPYAPPALPVADARFGGPHAFDDFDFHSIPNRIQMKKKLFKCRPWRPLKRKCKVRDIDPLVVSEAKQETPEPKKLLQKFRFVGFEGTLHELKKRIPAMSTCDGRREMLLVLVNKSRGRAEAVHSLLQLALGLENDPVHVRASIVRRLVKQASAWRLPQDVWDKMLEYARGLGLDGSTPEAECREGLHAVVMRQLIATGQCEKTVLAAFLNDFSTFTEYKLIKSERVKIGVGLQNILLNVAAESKPEVAKNYLNQILDLLDTFHIRVESSPVVSAIATLAERDSEVAKPLLMRLYKARVARRELLRQYLIFQYDDAGLLNALRHDPAALTPQWLVDILSIRGKSRATRFLLKLTIYFSENGGLVEEVRQLMLGSITQTPDVILARPLAILAGGEMTSILRRQDAAVGERSKLTAELRANMHRARPAPDALAIGWQKAGMKAIAYRAMRCRPAHLTELVKSLLQKKVKPIVRLVLVLAQRTDFAADIFQTAVTIRPKAALRAAVLYFRKLGNAADSRVWDIVKSIIPDVDFTRCQGMRHILFKLEYIPKAVKPDYCAMLYLAIENSFDKIADNVIEELMEYLSEISDNLLESVLSRMLEQMDRHYFTSYPAIFIRYLMLSKNPNELKKRLGNIAEPFFNKIDYFREHIADAFAEEFNNLYPDFYSVNQEQILSSLQYNLAFFDIKYECCLPVIEMVLTWMQKFMPKEIHFDQYVKIHATMLYYKAVRQSLKQRPEIFEDPMRKNCEGVQVVGFTFGRYIAKEVTELMSNYFDSVIEIYSKAFFEYLNDYFQSGNCREKFVEAITMGICSEAAGRETRLAVYVLDEYNLNSPISEEIKQLISQSKDIETQFFLHAEIFA